METIVYVHPVIDKVDSYFYVDYVVRQDLHEKLVGMDKEFDNELEAKEFLQDLKNILEKQKGFTLVKETKDNEKTFICAICGFEHCEEEDYNHDPDYYVEK